MSIVERQIAILDRQADRAMDDMEMITGVQLRRHSPPPRPSVILAGSTFHNINITNSNVGVVNTGDLQQIDTAVSIIEKSGDAQLAGVLKLLTEAVLRHAAFSDAQRREAVEILGAIASEATLPKKQRRAGVAKPLIARLREALAVSADLATVAQAAIPILSAAFGV